MHLASRSTMMRSLTFLVLPGDQELGPRGVVYTSASCFPAIQKQRCLRHGRGNWLAFCEARRLEPSSAMDGIFCRIGFYASWQRSVDCSRGITRVEDGDIDPRQRDAWGKNL